MGNWGLMYFFSACMSSKISQLKFGAHKFERVQWNRIKSFENNSWSKISIRSSRAQTSPLLGSLICPLLHQRAPNVPLRHQGLIFPVSPSGHLASPTQFPHCFIKCFQFPHCVMKGPKIFHCAIKGPQFPHHVIKMMTSNFPSRYQEVPIYHCVIKGPPLKP